MDLEQLFQTKNAPCSIALWQFFAKFCGLLEIHIVVCFFRVWIPRHAVSVTMTISGNYREIHIYLNSVFSQQLLFSSNYVYANHEYVIFNETAYVMNALNATNGRSAVNSNVSGNYVKHQWNRFCCLFWFERV